jgi:hypothetical protein
MRYLCTVAVGETVTFLGDAKKIDEGAYYYLEEATNGTEAQRRTREPLIKEYWKSGLHPKYGGDSFADFREKMKRDLGEGVDKYIYGFILNGKPKTKEVKDKSEIPKDVMDDPERSENIMTKIKSFTNYTKKQQARFIDNIIDDMKAAGVNSKKFDEILEGMKDV